MKREEFDRAERREVSEKDVTDAVKALLESPPAKVPNRTPSRKELNEKHRLDRVKNDRVKLLCGLFDIVPIFKMVKE